MNWLAICCRDLDKAKPPKREFNFGIYKNK